MKKANLLSCLAIPSIIVMSYYLGYTQHKSCNFGICDDPRACEIHWDDGTVQWKSRVIELGTLAPNKAIVVNLIDPNDLTAIDEHGIYMSEKK